VNTWDTIPPNEEGSDEFSVRPQTGLPVGTYYGVVTVETSNAGSKTRALSFTVNNLATIKSVVISGTPKVGSTLTANVTYSTPVTNPSVTYSWDKWRGSAWVSIPDATSETYTPVSADVGFYIRLLVTGTGTNVIGSEYAEYVKIEADQITYTVAFNANGGSGTMASQSHTYGTSKALTLNTFTRLGYMFAGWASSAGGAVVYTDGQIVSNLTSTNGATETLYAVWLPYGDVDGNGIVDIFDALYLARHLAEWPGYETVSMVADADGNGVVDIFDALYLARHLAEWPGYEILGPK
jgi:hypothetical protein